MANPPVTASEHEPIRDRIRRELRNPSMLTVMLIIVAFLAVPIGLLAPSWVETTRGSLQDRNADAKLREAAMLSTSVLVPSQIAPWMLDQIERMETAESPAAWTFTSFTEGPCHPNNLSQLPEGQFSDAIAAGCTSLQQIQADHAAECPSIQVCNFSPRAKERLEGVRAALLTTFAEANFVLPYQQEEETAR